MPNANASKELDDYNQAYRISPPQAGEPVVPRGWLGLRGGSKVRLFDNHHIISLGKYLLSLTIGHSFGTLGGRLGLLLLLSLGVVVLNHFLNSRMAVLREGSPVALQTIVNSLLVVGLGAKGVNIIGTPCHRAARVVRFFLVRLFLVRLLLVRFFLVGLSVVFSMVGKNVLTLGAERLPVG